MDEPNNAQQTDQTEGAQAQAQEPGGTPNDAGQAEVQPSQAPQTGEGQGGEPKAPSFGSLLDSGDDGEEGGQKGAPSNGDQEDGAPESYEPFSVDGQTIEVENAQEFVDMAKELGLSQEKAQKVMDAMVPAARNYLMVHYPTDVIAAFIVGGAAAVAAFFIVKAIWKALQKHSDKSFISFILNFDIRSIFKSKKTDKENKNEEV